MHSICLFPPFDFCSLDKKKKIAPSPSPEKFSQSLKTNTQDKKFIAMSDAKPRFNLSTNVQNLQLGNFTSKPPLAPNSAALLTSQIDLFRNKQTLNQAFPDPDATTHDVSTQNLSTDPVVGHTTFTTTTTTTTTVAEEDGGGGDGSDSSGGGNSGGGDTSGAAEGE